MRRGLSALAVLGALGIILFLLARPNGMQSRYDVAIVNFVEHPVLSLIEDQVVAGIEEKYSDSEVKITTFSAQGKVDELTLIANKVLSGEYELVITISTPVSQAIFMAADANQRLVYTFVTDRQSLGEKLTSTNNTGLSDAVNYAANVELIRRLFGEEARIGFAYNPNEPNSVAGLAKLETLLQGTNLKLSKATVTSDVDVPLTIRRLVASGADVIYVGGDNTTVGAFPAVAKAANDEGIPVIASDSGSIENGAVAGVSVDYYDFGRRTSSLVLDVIAGKEPKDIARINVPGDKLIVNLNAAERVDFMIPKSVVEEADRVIE